MESRSEIPKTTIAIAKSQTISFDILVFSYLLAIIELAIIFIAPDTKKQYVIGSVKKVIVKITDAKNIPKKAPNACFIG